MKLKFFNHLVLLSCCIITHLITHAQLELEGGVGIATPFTGYGKVVAGGGTYALSATHHFRLSPLSVGLEAGVAHFGKDRNGGDAFSEAKLTIIPLLAQFGYERKIAGPFNVKAQLGLGAAIYTFYYVNTPPVENSSTNVSFAFQPAIGVNFAASRKIHFGVQFRSLFMADGPPAGFPESNKMTGYSAVLGTISYRIGK